MTKAFAKAFRTLLWIVGGEILGIVGVIAAVIFGAPVGPVLAVLLLGAVVALGGLANLLRAYFVGSE